MKKLMICCFFILFVTTGFAQMSLLKGKSVFGVKAGLNFANVTGVSSFSNSNKSGFMAGGFFGTGSKFIGYRTELIFSRQGYDYKTGTKSGSVNLDYILLPQLTTISLGKKFQLQIGAHLAYLMNAKADTTSPTGIQQVDNILKFYNRFDYGIGGGLEIFPYKGLLLGLRYNVSMASLYKDNANPYQFIPTVNKEALKNNLIQLAIGWKFGK